MNTTEFLVLVALATEDLHGYGIVGAVETHTGGRVRLRPGNLYRVLDRMLDRGLVERLDRRQVRDPVAAKRRYYRISDQGRRAMAAEADLLATVLAGTPRWDGALETP
ncbi:MAG: helix-turn-helix transcriptional regulator [Acidobacteria bacterium]|nr:helix-turn-helix transcriptional regulator [Acidobacteriota bacterium]